MRHLIDADADYLTCPKCRAVISVGRQCRCSMRTTGPKVEGVLARIITGRSKVTRPRR